MLGGMEHVVAHPRPGTLIFRTWEEGLLLWRLLLERVPLRALAIMPDHLHGILEDTRHRQLLISTLVAFAQARNARRGESGPVWSPGIDAAPVRGGQHVRRTDRYVFLNPARAGLVSDPLGWPLSSYRDWVGLAIPGTREPHPDPEGFHAVISADPAVSVQGSPFPKGRPGDSQPADLSLILAAVSALTRTTLPELRRRGPARTLLLEAARELSGARATDIARFAGVDTGTVYRAAQQRDPRVRMVEQVLGDPRFPALHEGDLRQTAEWKLYRGRR